MRWLCLIFLFGLSAVASAQSDFEVRLGANLIEVEARGLPAGKLPREAEAIAGDHLHYRIWLCPVFPVQVLTPRGWLPAQAGPYRLHIQCQAGVNFVTSLTTGSQNTLLINQDQLAQRPLFAFGRLAVRQHHFQGGSLTEAYVPGALKLSDGQLTRWVQATGEGVADFFGRFPVDQAVLLITPLSSGSIQGVTFGQGDPYIRVQIPSRFSPAEIAGSWQLCHEMVHLAVPDMPYAHHWLEEGIATYVEPLIRLKMGDIRAQRVWLDLLEGLPKGIADVEAAGLDGDHRWGATYWGGALFCLLVDVRLRAESHNQHTLQEALRGVVARGNISQSWTLSDFLDIADEAVHSQVLHQVHEELERRAPINLDQLWGQLGVASSPRNPRFTAAPLDFVRRGITPEF
ncbi:hypothetical protein JST97_23890 [bacterium]|nr:hypothetical protein [bacterium]